MNRGRGLCAALLLAPAWMAPAQDDLAARGQLLYREQKCPLCHSVAGRGNPKGPHDAVGDKWSTEEMRQWLLRPADMAARVKARRKPPMIPFTHLTRDEQDALIAFLQTLRRK